MTHDTSQFIPAWLQQRLSQYPPEQLVLVTALCTLLLVSLVTRTGRWLEDLRDTGLVGSALATAKALPGVRGFVARKQAELKEKIRKSTSPLAPDAVLELPEQGCPPGDVRKRLTLRGRVDTQFEEGRSRASGTLYLAGGEHAALLNEVYAHTAHTNPMHASVFPSLRTMELEVVAMTAALLGGGTRGRTSVCGAMTSGGTESILTAVKAARDHARETRGIRRPELVIGVSAHAAFVKAAEYFGLRLRKVPVGPDFRVTAAAVRRALSPRTAMVVASAPCFPHGVLDDVAGIAELARRRGIWCHVDCCLGGFVLPFARDLGYPVPPFDFSVPGVCSISADTHKFGMAHKGTSVVLYASQALRRHQYTRITDWTGGLYISPGFAGSRSGALIATAWAALLHQGRAGYLAHTRRLMEAAREFEEGIRAMPGLEVTGQPVMCVVGFRAASSPSRGQPKTPPIDIYQLNDRLSDRGWHLNALQMPPAIHMCFTAQHTGVVQQLLQDIRECKEALERDGVTDGNGAGMAPVYGLASASIDRAAVGDFLAAYQDVLLSG